MCNETGRFSTCSVSYLSHPPLRDTSLGYSLLPYILDMPLSNNPFPSAFSSPPHLVSVRMTSFHDLILVPLQILLSLLLTIGFIERVVCAVPSLPYILFIPQTTPVSFPHHSTESVLAENNVILVAKANGYSQFLPYLTWKH